MPARSLLLLMGLLAAAGEAHAACSGPVGSAGDVRYATNFGTLAFCNGTDWISTAGWGTSASGGATLLNELTDVDTTGAASGKILSYNGSTWVVSDSTVTDARIGTLTAGKWCTSNGTIISCTVDAPLTVSATLNDLSDVDTTGAATGKVLAFNGTSWVVSNSAVAGVTSAASSTGAIQFNSGNALAGDTSNLFWDDANNWLGIGTSTPGTKLQVDGGIVRISATSYPRLEHSISSTLTWSTGPRTGGDYYIYRESGSGNVLVPSGNLGIGTMSPNARLDVVGNVSVTGMIDVGHTAQACATAISGSIRYETTSDTLQICTSAGWKSLTSATVPSSPVDGTGSANHIGYWSDANTLTYDSSQLYWDATNNRLGIGTATPNAALQVSGGLIVSSSGAAIYVADRTVGVSTSALYRANGITRLWDSLAGDVMAYNTAGNVGIGTTSIPHGTIGYAKFAMDGAAGSGLGPHVQYTVDTDDYPVFQQLNWGHDNIALNFDSYFDTAWKSSDAGSNFQIYKQADLLRFNYDSGIAAGSAVTWNSGIVLEPTGHVGINTANPNASLDVNGIVSATALRAADGDTATAPGHSWATDTNTGMFHPISDVIGFSINGTERVRMTSSAVSLTAALAMNSYAITMTSGTVIDAGGGWHRTYGNTGWYNGTYGGGWYMTDSTYIRNFNTKEVLLSANITAPAFLYSSDKRLKTDIQPITGGLAKLDVIKPVTFTFVSDTAPRREHLGVIAQDVEKVYPQAVYTDEQGFKRVDYPALVPALIAALKELNGRVGDLELKLKAANDNFKAANDNLLHRVESLETARKASAR